MAISSMASLGPNVVPIKGTEIALANGWCLTPTYAYDADGDLHLHLSLPSGLTHESQALTAPPLLHWGIVATPKSGWEAITAFNVSRIGKNTVVPSRTEHVLGASRSSFEQSKDGYTLDFVFKNVKGQGLDVLPEKLAFVLNPVPNVWVKEPNDKDAFIPVKSAFVQIFGFNELKKVVKETLRFWTARRDKEGLGGLHASAKWTVGNDLQAFEIRMHSFSFDRAWLVIYVFTNTPHPLVLHWSFGTAEAPETWRSPDVTSLESSLPSTLRELEAAPLNEERFVYHPVDDKALQTEFKFVSKTGDLAVQWLRLVVAARAAPSFVSFVVKEKYASKWFKRPDGGDFRLAVAYNREWEKARQDYERAETERKAAEEQRLRLVAEHWDSSIEKFKKVFQKKEELAENVSATKHFKLAGDIGQVHALVTYNDALTSFEVEILACLKVPCLLHWGVTGGDVAGHKRRSAVTEWKCPPESIRPKGSEEVDPAHACQTPLAPEGDDEAGLYSLTIHIPAASCPPASPESPPLKASLNIGGVAFVMKEKDGGRWFKSHDNSDMVIRLWREVRPGGWKGSHQELVNDIVAAEVEWDHMTLMHRYNLLSSIVNQWLNDNSNSLRRGNSRAWTSIFKTESVTTLVDYARTRVQRDVAGDILPETLCQKHSPLDAEPEAGAKPVLLSLPSYILGGTVCGDEGAEFWSWLYVWCRLSYMGHLDWQRNYNTKPRDLSHATEVVTYTFTEAYIKVTKFRPFIRLCLSTLGRGGGQGQVIRDRILEIMHRHRIPEAAGNFYEQWHQKLHNNTTPDDIAICSAIIAFLRSGGNLGEFRRVLGEHGITRERLASYERKITSDPYLVHCDIGALIGDLEGYLDVLKDVHDAVDLKKAFDHAKRFLPGDMQGMVWDIVQGAGGETGVRLKANTGAVRECMSGDEAQWQFCKIAEVRRHVASILSGRQVALDQARELLFLDFALEQQQTIMLQRSSQFNMVQLTKQLLELCLSLSAHEPRNLTLQYICKDLSSLGEKCANKQFGSGALESALMLKALADRVSLYVGEHINQFQALLNPKAAYLGDQVGVEKKVLDIFVDEVLRGSALFAVSLTLQRLEPLLRAEAQLPPWQMISPVSQVIQGQLVKIDRLTNIQDLVYEEPTILLSGAVNGEEEVPSGVQAVLIRSAAESPDILSHISVRARNAHVLLAVCFDQKIVQQLDALEGKWISVAVTPDFANLTFKELSSPPVQSVCKLSKLYRQFDRKSTQDELGLALGLAQHKARAEMDLSKVAEKWVIDPSEFSSDLVGSKSLNLQKLTSLPPHVIKPQAIAMPFGTFQKTLSQKCNAAVLESLKTLIRKLSPSVDNQTAQSVFSQIRDTLDRIEMPEGLRTALTEAVSQGSRARLQQLFEEGSPDETWEAIKTVWKSLFALRPWVSLSKAHRNYNELNMAILIQELLPATYAFVLHSKNPFGTSHEAEMYGELVPGLGETLVGNAPGRALSWRMKRNGEPVVVAFPSKQHMLVPDDDCLIFRSDSNGEDLEGFAGAGLFESITTIPPVPSPTCYSSYKLVTDAQYRGQLLKSIGDLAFVIEDHFKAPMDIEGVVLADDVIGVVQARPQV